MDEKEYLFILTVEVKNTGVLKRPRFELIGKDEESVSEEAKSLITINEGDEVRVEVLTVYSLEYVRITASLPAHHIPTE